jgi:lipoprotein-anchoring transpeptidase ErfK/SrfK
MKFKFILGLFVASMFGLAFGQSLVSIGEAAHVFVANNFSKINNLSSIISKYSDSGLTLLKKEKEMGGQSLNAGATTKILEYEDFPGNEPDSVNIGKISEDLSIPEAGKAIVANLESMKLDLYEDGKVIESFEILSKGRPGTAWETPPGAFEILYKQENHFSTIGKVWMPFSMQFFGNYFIHGWPYYPDGTPVSEGYSGGCIRLSTSDAETVYNFSEVGIKTILLGATQESISFTEKGTYTTKAGAKFPKITAKSYLVADLESGDIITAYGEKIQLPIASLSKMMTALISLETLNQYKETTVSRKAFGTYGAQGNLLTGEKIIISDLLYPLLLESSNDAAEVLAEFAGRDNFIKNMNDKAISIGLKNTLFEDPSGLSANNLSTAEDLFKLTRYIFKYKSYVFEITKLKDYTEGRHTWYNNSKFRNDKNYLGGKNGYTDEAQHTLVTMVELPLGEFEKRKIAIVILNAEKTEKDARAIILYLLNNVYYTE